MRFIGIVAFSIPETYSKYIFSLRKFGWLR